MSIYVLADCIHSKVAVADRGGGSVRTRLVKRFTELSLEETYSKECNLLLDSDFRFNYGALLWAYYPEYKGLRQFVFICQENN